MEKTSFIIEIGDIVRVCLDPTIGHEKQKERFCLVIMSVFFIPIKHMKNRKNWQV